MFKVDERQLSSMQPVFKALSGQAKLQASITPNFDQISNMLSAMQPILDMEAQLKASMQPIFDMQAQWKSSMQPILDALSTQAKLQADIKPTFDQISNVLSAMNGRWTPVRRARQNTNRTKLVIRQSHPIRIRDEDADFELRMSHRIYLSEDADCIWGR